MLLLLNQHSVSLDCSGIKSSFLTAITCKTSSATMSNNFYDIVETAADGSEVSFKKFEGKVVYGVNVASE